MRTEMGEIGLAGLFISLAVLIVLTGPARLLKVVRVMVDMLRGVRRDASSERRKAAAGD
jgi:Sec-independent protein translocase protein TatA